jgi:hypothetical protein
MDAAYNFSLGFAQERESETETPNPLFIRQTRLLDLRDTDYSEPTPGEK